MVPCRVTTLQLAKAFTGVILSFHEDPANLGRLPAARLTAATPREPPQLAARPAATILDGVEMVFVEAAALKSQCVRGPGDCFVVRSMTEELLHALALVL